MEKDYWKGKHYAYFCNRKCEYFPCHKTDDPDNFNCLFCYCPLYVLGEKCGGNFAYLANGNKDCSRCDFPHRREGLLPGGIRKLWLLLRGRNRGNDQEGNKKAQGAITISVFASCAFTIL